MIYIAYICEDIRENLKLKVPSNVTLISLSGHHELEKFKDRYEISHYDFFIKWMEYLNSSAIFNDLGIFIDLKDENVRDDFDFLNFVKTITDNVIPQRSTDRVKNTDTVAVFPSQLTQEKLEEIIHYNEIIDNEDKSNVYKTTGGGGIERHPVLGSKTIFRDVEFIFGSYHAIWQYSKVSSLQAALANIPLVNGYSVIKPHSIFECVENYLGIKNDYKS